LVSEDTAVGEENSLEAEYIFMQRSVKNSAFTFREAKG